MEWLLFFQQFAIWLDTNIIIYIYIYIYIGRVDLHNASYFNQLHNNFYIRIRTWKTISFEKSHFYKIPQAVKFACKKQHLYFSHIQLFVQDLPLSYTTILQNSVQYAQRYPYATRRPIFVLYRIIVLYCHFARM